MDAEELEKQLQNIRENKHEILDKFTKAYLSHLYIQNKDFDIEKVVLCQKTKLNRDGDMVTSFYFKIEENKE